MGPITIVDIMLYTLIALGSATFCVFLAIGVGYISFSKKVPRLIFWTAIITQAGLSIGIYIMALLWYYSQATPDGMPKDFITGAAIAYTAGAFPGTTLGILVILFSILRTYLKKFLKGQSDEELEDIMPSLKMQALIDRYYQDMRRAERERERAESDSAPTSRPRRAKPKIEAENTQSEKDKTEVTDARTTNS